DNCSYVLFWEPLWCALVSSGFFLLALNMSLALSTFNHRWLRPLIFKKLYNENIVEKSFIDRKQKTIDTLRKKLADKESDYNQSVSEYNTAVSEKELAETERNNLKTQLSAEIKKNSVLEEQK